MADLTQLLRAQALTEGFEAVGICAPDAAPETAGRLAAYLEKGYHGQMAWMAERTAWRGNAAALWPEAKSIIMLAQNYGPDEDPLRLLDMPDRGSISVYARNRDYHTPVKKRLKRLGRWLIAQEPCDIKVFVDTAPVMEKPLAQAAGLGWQGKHTNVVSRKLGSWFFLGAIFTTLDLDKDAPEPDHCGNCTNCLDICPTNAFPAPYQLDPRRCISYLTIEHKGPVDLELRSKLGNRIYGCDDCLAVCPWNKFAQVASDAAYWARIELRCPKLEHLAALDDASFREVFQGSPIKRIGRDRFTRNVLYAIGNSKDTTLIPTAERLMSDPDMTISDAAGWARAQLVKA
ncbi:MAG: tRNA epoxyqueuosine(34) reductase QueG [Rhodobacteraceae bacterium]|nr:tRNA epoxyqueuosine(34) reductase QueG [Paracoccaceae bacterium]